MKTLLGISLFALTVHAVACQGDTVPVGGDEDEDAGQSSSSGSALPSTDAGGEGDANDGPRVLVTVRGHGDAVAHDPATAGQTPSQQSMAISSLTLLRSVDDPNPYVVFDYGAASRETDVTEGSSTDVASVPVASLRAGSYTIARCGVAFVRYRVAVTMHAAGQQVPGVFDNLQVLSDGVDVDGQRRDSGYYRSAFSASGAQPAVIEGTNGTVAQARPESGFTLDLSTSAAAYVFPVSLLIPEGVDANFRIVFDLNTHENFRWTDQTSAGYATDVFDATPSSYEPVVSFGANSFVLTTELVP